MTDFQVYLNDRMRQGERKAEAMRVRVVLAFYALAALVVLAGVGAWEVLKGVG